MLTPLKKKIKKYKFFGFDIETYSDYNYFYMGSVVGKNFSKIFYNKQKFIQLLNSMCGQNNIFFATNLGFDFFALFENTKNLYKSKIVLRGSDLIFAYYFHNNEKLLFLDTRNFAQFSVKSLGKIINCPKYEHPKFLGKLPKNAEEQKELERYNLRDSEISYKFAEFLELFFNEFNTSINYTIASTSMKIFRINFLSCDLCQPSKKEINELNLAYYGGRTEAFKRGKFTNQYYYDFNSLYPAQYLKEFPNPNFMRVIKNPDIDILKYEGVSVAKIKTPKLSIPLLPLRQKSKLIFPIGEFIGSWTHVELRKALELGHKIKLIKSFYFIRNFKPFEKFGTELYNLRMKYKQQNNAFELPIKLCLNSLYGKFNQKSEYNDIDFIEKYSKKELIEIIKKNKVSFIGKYMYIEKKNNKIPNFIQPIFSIYTTAYARLVLYSEFEKIGEENINYCDTDSIITNKIIPVSDKLGELKIEHYFKNLIIVKPKIYAGETENGYISKCKGIPSNLFSSYDNFISFLKSPKISYDKFVKFRQAIKSKEEYKYGELKFNQKICVNKKLLLDDDKRNWKKKFNFYETQSSSPLKIINFQN